MKSRSTVKLACVLASFAGLCDVARPTASAALLEQAAAKEPELVRPRLIWVAPAVTENLPPDQAAPKRPGQPRHAALAIQLAIEPGWHVYWPGQNDSGSPVEIDLTLPEGWKAGPIQWPAPVRHVADGDLLDHVLEGRPVLIVPIEVPGADAPAGGGGGGGGGGGSAADEPAPPRITAKLAWMVCKEACKVGKAEVVVDAPLVPPDRSLAADMAIVESARKAIPRPLAEAAGRGGEGRVVARITQDPGVRGPRLRITAPGASRLEFAPHGESVAAADPLRECVAKGPELDIRLVEPAAGAGGGGPDASPGKPPRVRGVLRVVRPGKPEAVELFEVDVPLAGPVGG